MNSPDKHKWIEEMQEEIESLKKNKVWTLVENNNDQKLLQCRWVLRIKLNDDCSKRYKARLVIKRYSQSKILIIKERSVQ